MKAQLLRKRWLLDLYAKGMPADVLGQCDPPDTPGKRIAVRANLTGERRLEVLLHELLHAANWDQFSEEWVSELARDLARILWRSGYRGPK